MELLSPLSFVAGVAWPPLGGVLGGAPFPCRLLGASSSCHEMLLESVSRMSARVCGPSSCFQVTYSGEKVNTGKGEFDGNAIFTVTRLTAPMFQHVQSRPSRSLRSWEMPGFSLAGAVIT